MKKKKFEKPQIKIIELMSTDIICTSNQIDTFSLEDMQYQTETW